MKNNLIKITILSLSLFSFLTFGFMAHAQADDVEPSDVENLTATALSEAARLQWSAATDNVRIKGYKVYYGESSVTEQGQTYDLSVDAGNVTSYVVEGLTNNTKYYFSVIAYDEAGNESKMWAPEASATPSVSAGNSADTTSPTVSLAEALNVEQVKIVFSEKVKLPVEFPEDSFAIENQDNFEPLLINSAKIDETDSTGKTIILDTQAQTLNSKYKLTVGIQIEDMFGNRVISGTSDTAEFTGSNTPKPSEDTAGPELKKVEIADSTHIIVTFNETIVLGLDPTQNFSISLQADPTKQLTILGVDIGRNEQGVEDAAVVITTSDQSSGNYVLTVSGIKDNSGNVVSPDKSTAVFRGMSADNVTPPVEDDDIPEDESPSLPKDVANFLSKKMFDAGDYVVKLSWNLLLEGRENIKEQILYLSSDLGKNYSKKDSLAPEVSDYEVSGLTAGEYWFKLTQVDAEGNESLGVVTKVKLAETGPELLGLLFGSVFLRRILRKKQK